MSIGHASDASYDDVQSMAVFVKVIDAGSFTAAARMLATSTSAVSKRLARLEEQLGVRLIDRTTRSLAPTEAGSAFYERSVRILRDVDEARHAVMQLGAAPRGTLRVSTVVGFGELYLAELSPRLLAAYPDLRIEIEFTDGPVNLIGDGYDVAIRVFPTGAMPDSSLIVRRLGTLRSVVCAAPSYLERRGVPRTLDDLLDHDCLHFSAIPLAAEWSFPTPEGTRVIPVKPRLAMSSSSGLRTAAIAGAGLLHTGGPVVTDALAAGTLQCVLEEYASSELGIYATYAAGKQALPKVRAFVDLLAREM